MDNKKRITTLFCCKRIRVGNVLEQDEVRCPECRKVLLANYSYQGYVYLLANISFPDQLKIGYTERTVTERMDELSATTGLPYKFQLIAYFIATNGMSDETLIHNELNNYRTSVHREFFKISPRNAVSKITEILGLSPEYINEQVMIDFNEVYERNNPKTYEGNCSKCNLEMRKLKKGGYKCRKCGSIYK